MIFAEGARIIRAEVIRGTNNEKDLYSVNLKLDVAGVELNTNRVFHVDEITSVFDLIWNEMGNVLKHNIKTVIEKGE